MRLAEARPPEHQPGPAKPSKMAELDKRALVLIARAAPGEAFEELHRQGWRTWSQRNVDREGRALHDWAASED